MGNHISNLPLQDMIAGVVRSATEKLAADEEAEKKVKEEIKGESLSDDKGKESCGDKSASWTDPEYVEKLASACDFISQNVDDIDTPNRGVLGNAIAKIAEGDTGVTVPPVNPAGALDATTPPEGKEKYKDDKPLAGYDSAVSQADTPETTGGQPGGKTQISNDMNNAPGQASGSVPTAEYPPAGPLHSGPTKTAAQVAREKILRKLAGEDTMPAKVTSPTAGGPLVGEGEMPALTAEEVPSLPTDGSGYGNEARKNIASNDAAINTEKKVKKVQVPQLAEILNNPAFSKKHDGRLQEQLRNTGKAGVKIAGARAEEIIKQAAADGRINQETINRFAKLAEEAPAATEQGCDCDGAGTCKVCKLKSLKEKDSQGDMGGGMGDGGMGL
jgi:hypothetical protein